MKPDGATQSMPFCHPDLTGAPPQPKPMEFFLRTVKMHPNYTVPTRWKHLFPPPPFVAVRLKSPQFSSGPAAFLLSLPKFPSEPTPSPLLSPTFSHSFPLLFLLPGKLPLPFSTFVLTILRSLPFPKACPSPPFLFFSRIQ